MVIARSIFVVRTQQISCNIRNFVLADKNGTNKGRKLCFVINVLNDSLLFKCSLQADKFKLTNGIIENTTDITVNVLKCDAKLT